MSEYKICYNCGQPFKFSENINQATGKPFKINENGMEHDCAANIKVNRKKKYENTIKVEDENGNQFNAMLCKYLCKERVYRDESLFVEPKLREVGTGFQHNYQRCFNVHVNKGIQEGIENFGVMTYALTWDELVDGMTQEEINSLKMSMPPDSKIRIYFDPGRRDPLVGKRHLDNLGMTLEEYDLITKKTTEKEQEKKRKEIEQEEEDKEQVKLF
jgi:hypothetical protein